MEIISPDILPASGLLNQRLSMEKFDLIRIAPSQALAPFVQNYWIIVWDLEGKPDYVQENLPHPNVNLVVDPFGQSGVFGVQAGKFVYRLSGSGRLFGTKFYPGAFRQFLAGPVGDLFGKRRDIATVFGQTDKALELALIQQNAPENFATIIETMLLSKKPHLDENAKAAREVVELIGKELDLFRVDRLAKLVSKSERSLQRLFENYVGVSPKWVIDRTRMLAAVDVLNSGNEINLTNLAHRLGFFDSAHFGRTFHALTGVAPSAMLTQS